MKLFRTTLMCLGLGVVLAHSELPPGWNTNYSQTLSNASVQQRPALVFFTASWCGPCRLMARLTLGDPDVVEKLSGIEHAVVDIDDNKDFAAKLSINAVPTFVLLSGNGEEVKRSTGFQPVNEFLNWLTNGISAAKEAGAQAAFLKSRLTAVDALLNSTNSDERHRAAAELFDLCAARDQPIVQAVAARLQTLVAHDPLSVLPGLTDKRLATRISVANALRARLGESFDVDAWSDAPTREKAVETWRKKLSL